MKKIQLTQGQVALIDDVDYEYLSQWKWYASWEHNGFRAIRKLPWVNNKRKTLRMHTAVAERMKIDSKKIDHRDQNPLNNQRSNLRSATASQNGHNRGPNKNNTTGVKGISFDKRSGRYQAQIQVEGKKYWLGYFNTLEEAAIVIQKKREELVGEFACN